jgi:hypothetical protein
MLILYIQMNCIITSSFIRSVLRQSIDVYIDNNFYWRYLFIWIRLICHRETNKEYDHNHFFFFFSRVRKKRSVNIEISFFDNNDIDLSYPIRNSFFLLFFLSFVAFAVERIHLTRTNENVHV